MSTQNTLAYTEYIDHKFRQSMHLHYVPPYWHNVPKAQTACSHTFWWFERRRDRKRGTAPAPTTACVCADVPLAIFVSAHAASNWRTGLQQQTQDQFHNILHVQWFHADVCIEAENSPVMVIKTANQYWQYSAFHEGIDGGIAVWGQEFSSRLDGVQLDSTIVTTCIGN